MEEETRLTAELLEEEDEECSSLESSLTEMDWLSQLNVGGVLANISNGQGDSGSSERSIELDLDDGGDIKTGESYSNSRDSNSVSKPPYSYTHLITAAINSSSMKKMTLSEIYLWISANYPYYQNAGYGWKNSIRHNLSLNKHFVKQSRAKDDPGKGSYWALCEHSSNSQNSMKLPQRRSHKQKFVHRQLQTSENPLKFVPTETVDLSGLTEADLLEALKSICKNSSEVLTEDADGTINALTLKSYITKFCQENLNEPQQFVEASFDGGNALENQSNFVEIFSMLSQCVNNSNNINNIHDSIVNNPSSDVTTNGFLMQTDPTSNLCKNLDTLLYQSQIPTYSNIAVVSDAGSSLMSTPEEAYLLYSNNIQENFLQSGDFMSVMQQIDTNQSQGFPQLEPSNFECDGNNIIPSFTQMIEGIDLDNISWDPTEDIV